MSRRASVTAARVREILIAQAHAAGAPIPCALCGAPMLPGQAFTLEHLHALKLGGDDLDVPEAGNGRFAHSVCAKRKTFGTKATTAGSDLHLIAKGKRLRGETGEGRLKRQIKSRGFDKTKTRRLDGTVIEKDKA